MARDRRWSGGIANRTWNRAAGQESIGRLDPEEEHDLYLSQLDQSFWCEACGGHHPLREHGQCRNPTPPPNLQLQTLRTLQTWKSTGSSWPTR